MLRQPFLDQQMGVDASETESGDGGTAGHPFAAPLPRGGAFEHLERASIEPEAGGRLVEVRRRGKGLFGHGQEDLGQRCGTGGGQKVPDVGLHRADDATVAGGFTPEFPEAPHLGGVADRCAGGVALDQVHVLRRPAGLGVGGAHGAQLPVGHGGKEAPPHVVGKTDPLDDAVDPVPLRDGVVQTLEDEDAGPFPHDQAVAGSVERRADAAARQGAQLGEAHLGVEGIGTGKAAGEHGVGAAGKKLVAGEFDGVKRRGAGRIQGAAPSAQTQGSGQEPRGKACHVAVQGVGDRLVTGVPEELFLEVPAQERAGEFRGLFARQRQVADDDADAGAVQLGGDRAVEGPFAGVQQEVEGGVQPVGKLRVDLQTRELRQGRDGLYEAAAPGVDVVRFARLGIEGGIGRQSPAAGRDLARRAFGVTDVFPKSCQFRRVGKDPADAYDCHGRRLLLHAYAAPTTVTVRSLLRWKACLREGSMTHS